MEALMIMIIGMGGVFVFLTVLVGLMILIDRLAPYVAPPPAPASSPATPATAETQLVAVIQAAISAYEADTAR